MPIFLKISFMSQSTQNLSAALRILNVNPASTAASVFVEGNSAIISDMHTLSCHGLDFCYILWQVPVQSSRKEPQLTRNTFSGEALLLILLKSTQEWWAWPSTWNLPLSTKAELCSLPLCRAADVVFAEGWSLKWHKLLPSSASPLPLLFPGSEPPSLFPEVFPTTQVPPLAPWFLITSSKHLRPSPPNLQSRLRL